MEPISNDENNNPKSLGRLGYNTTFKNKIQFKNNFGSKKMARTPLKSKMNIMNSSQEENTIKIKKDKILKYPLLKSISSSNMNNKNKKNISYDINNNEEYDYDEDDEYNKDALPDEIEDFMYIKENEINIKNDCDDFHMNEITGYKKHDVKILENISPFGDNENYVLAAHFDDCDNDINNINNNNNDIISKKKLDDYFNENDIDMSDSDN